MDQRTIPGLVDLVLELKRRGLTIVTIEHNMQVMMRLADRILGLHAGRRIAFGKPEDCARTRRWSMPISGPLPMLLDVKDLEVAYGDYQVVWGVSLSVEAGRAWLCWAPMGCKSTVVNASAGCFPSKPATSVSRERAWWAGHACAGKPCIAHVLERRRVFPHLTILQNLTLGAWHPAAKAARAKSMDRVFSLFPRLSERKSQLARTLSGGEQQMLALGRGLMALPRLLMVDEPFLGLAPQVMEQMKVVFEALKAEDGDPVHRAERARRSRWRAAAISWKRAPRHRGAGGLADEHPRGAANFLGG